MSDSRQDQNDDDFLHESAVAFAEHNLVPPTDCDAVLDTMDNCVACVDGAHDQHRYEQHLETRAAHGMDADEVAQMRLQAMEDNSQHNNHQTSGAWDVADLNICGTDEFEDAKTTLEHTTSQQQKILKRAASPTPPSLHCTICYNDVHNFQNTAVTFCHFPCCGSEGREERSTQKVCTACIQLLSNPTADNNSKRIGRCPRCREWIVVQESGLVITTIQEQGQCQVCNQVKDCLVEDGVCDACFLGRRRPLFYECEQCHYPQRIPHPMYRYQDSPEKFGTTSWACQGPCQNFTMWRILPDQVRYIPVGDAPEVWNTDTLETARERVTEARHNMLELGKPKSGGCVIS